ncbi:alpha/beta hydrolase [Pseudomonas aeruginosa]|nr:alpha/beta hydrolase [Pseudomonas aeruginosa]
MGYVTTKDGVELFYKDWGPRDAQVIYFHHGWPPEFRRLGCADAVSFLAEGFRVVAHDRRGHGRSSRLDGHDMDHYADDVAAVVERLGVRGDPCRPFHRRRRGRPLHRPLSRRPGAEGGDHQRGTAADGEDRGQSGRPAEERLRRSPGAARGQSRAVLPGHSRRPVLWLQPSRAQPSEGIVRNWWRQGMMGGAKAHYDGIVAFSQTDFSDDLKRIDIPVLVMHGDDDQIVPYENSGVLSAKLLRNGTLEDLSGFPHGMPTTQAEVINADLLAFIRG